MTTDGQSVINFPSPCVPAEPVPVDPLTPHAAADEHLGKQRAVEGEDHTFSRDGWRVAMNNAHERHDTIAAVLFRATGIPVVEVRVSVQVIVIPVGLVPRATTTPGSF